MRSRSGRAVTGEVVLFGPRVAAVVPTRSPVAASSRPSSASAAPVALSLLPPVASLSKPGRRLDAKDAFLIADIVFALLLLGVASLPARALPSPRLAAVVVTRRVDLALVGAATLVVAAVAALLTRS